MSLVTPSYKSGLETLGRTAELLGDPERLASHIESLREAEEQAAATIALVAPAEEILCIREQIEKDKADSDFALEQANIKALSIIEGAEGQAQQRVANANAEAEQIKAAAKEKRAEAQEIEAAAKAKRKSVEDGYKALARHSQDLEAKEQKLSQRADDLNCREQELTEEKDKLREVRSLINTVC